MHLILIANLNMSADGGTVYIDITHGTLSLSLTITSFARSGHSVSVAHLCIAAKA